MNEEVLRKLYNNGSQYFSLPDFETFKTDMQDENKLTKFRESMSEYFSIPDIETFKSDIGFNPGKQEGVQTVAATAAPVTPEEPQQPTTFQQPSPLLEQELPIGVASLGQIKSQEAPKEEVKDQKVDPIVKSYADKIKSISEAGLTQEQLNEIERQIEEPKLTSKLVKSFGDFKTVTEEKYAYEDYLDEAKKLYADQEDVNISAVTDDQAIPVAKDLLRSELKNQITNEQRKQVLDDFEDEYSEGFVDNLKKTGFGIARLTNFGLMATAGEIGLKKVIESDVLPEGISEEYVTPVKDFFASVNEALTSKEDLEYEQGRKELKELIAQASEDKKTLAENKRKDIDVDVLAFDDNVEKAEELKKQINVIDNKFKLGEKLSEEEINAYNSTVQEFNGLAKDINYLGNKINKQAEELNDINVSSSDLEKAVEQAGKSYNALDVTVSRVVGSGLQLTSGVVNLFDDFLSITPTGVMINAISDELDLPSITSSVLNDTEKTSLIESFADKLKEIDKEEFTGKVRETQDYRTAFKSGDNFLDFALDVVSGQSINTAITAATGGVGLAILGGAAYGNKVDELEDRIQGKGDYALKGPEDIPLWKYYTTGLIVGGAEAGSEYVGLRQVRALNKSIGIVAKASPGNRAWYDLSTKKWSRKFAENVVQNAWQPIEEGGSEAIAQIAQNAADVYILGDDKNILEGVDEAFITGATFSGLAMSAPKTFVDASVAFRSSDVDIQINKRTKKLGELALRKQEINNKENKTQEDLDLLKEITAEQEILIQENYNEVKNVVTLLDELNFGQKQALIKNETKRASLIRKAKDISESKDLTKDQKESQIKELETQFKDLKNKRDLMLSRYNFDRQSQISHLYNTVRANETGKEIKIIDAENIEDAEVQFNSALDQAFIDDIITQEQYYKSKKEFAELKKELKKGNVSVSGQAINADNNFPFVLTLRNEAVDPNNGDSFVHGHEFLHASFFNKIRALGGDVVKISDLLYNHYKNNYITDKKQLRQFENDYKKLKRKGTKESESLWHEERIIAITKMIALAERSGKLDKSFLAKIKSAYNGLFTNPVEKTEAGKLKSGEDVFNMFLTYGTRFMSGDVKELVKLEKGLDIDASLTGEKIEVGSRFSRKELGDSIKALVPEGTTKAEYDSEVIGTVYLDLILGNKLHPLINKNLARFGVPKEQVTDEFYEDVKSQLFERSLQRFNPEKNDDLGGFVIDELQRFAIPDIVNQYKSQGRFQTTEQVEAVPTEGRVRPMQIAEETTTEDVVERAEEQEFKVQDKTFREKLGIEKGSDLYNSVIDSVRRTFGTKLPPVTNKKFRRTLIDRFRRELMKPVKDFIGKGEKYKDFVFNNSELILQKIPTRELVRLERREENKIFAEIVSENSSPKQVDDAVSKGLYLLPGASRDSSPTIYRKIETTPEQLWNFLTGNSNDINSARKTALSERLAQELALDATMMVLKDPEFNLIAKVEEVSVMMGEPFPKNYDAELGATIERDPSDTRFSKRDKSWEDSAKSSLPNSGIKDVDAFINKIKRGKWGMLTGENPDSIQATNEENISYNKKAVDWFNEKNEQRAKYKLPEYKLIPIFGKYGSPENSFFVEGLERDDAAEFARDLKQESVATNEGLVYKDGTINLIKKGLEKFNTKADDYYSVINIDGSNLEFQIEYDLDNLSLSLPTDVQNKLIDDGDGNYEFYHYSFERRDVLKPSSGDMARSLTSREEANALSSVGGAVMFYTDRDTKEPGVGDELHVVKIKKEKVYHFQSDVAGFYEKAKKLFNEKRPGQAFSPNYQAAWISKVMKDAGYEMLVTNWNRGRLRAQTNIEVTPESGVTRFSKKEKVDSKSKESIKKLINKVSRLTDNDKAREIVAKELRQLLKDSELSLFSKRTINKVITSLKNTNVSNMQKMLDKVDDAISNDEGRVERIKRYKDRSRAIKRIAKIGQLKELQESFVRVMGIDPKYLSKKTQKEYDSILSDILNINKKYDKTSRDAFKAKIDLVLDSYELDSLRAKEIADRINELIDPTKTLNTNLAKLEKDKKITKEERELITRFKSLLDESSVEDPMDGYTKEDTKLVSKVMRDNKKREGIEQDFIAILNQIQSAFYSNYDDGAFKLSELERRYVREASSITLEDIQGLSLRDAESIVRALEAMKAGFLTPELFQGIIKVRGVRGNMSIPLTEIKQTGVVDKAISKAAAGIINLLNSSSRKAKKTGIGDRLRSAPTKNYDQILKAEKELFSDGSKRFKATNIYKSLFRPTSMAFSASEQTLKRIEDKLKNATALLSRNQNKRFIQKAKIMVFQIQREYDSNLGNKEVNQAKDWINATIKDKDTEYNEYEIKELEKIRDGYLTEGQVDAKKLYDSLTANEKKHLQMIDEVYEQLTSMARMDAAVQGMPFIHRENYIHLPKSGTATTEISNDFEGIFDSFMNASVKNKAAIQRTGKTHSISFDPVSNAYAAARKISVGYHMYPVIKSTRVAFSGLKSRAETNFQKDLVNELESIYDTIINSQYKIVTKKKGFGDNVVNYLTRAGYYSQLSGLVKAASELGTNTIHAVMNHAGSLVDGYGILVGVDAKTIEKAIENTNTTQTDRLTKTAKFDNKDMEGKLLSKAKLFNPEQMTEELAASAKTVGKVIAMPFRAVFKLNESLITKPDEMVIRPLFVGEFQNRFKQLTGQKLNWEKLANDESYRDRFQEAINQASEQADAAIIDTSASTNPFDTIPSNISDPDVSAIIRAGQVVNRYMTNFRVFEYYSAVKGVQNLLGKGEISRGAGAMLLASTIMRMSIYRLGIDYAFGLIFSALGMGEDEDEIKKEDLTRSVLSGIVTLAFGRNLGNISQTVVNLGIEYANMEFGEGITWDSVTKDGEKTEYDPYKDSMVFSKIPVKRSPGRDLFTDFLISSAGPLTPTIKSVRRAITLTDRSINNSRKESRDKNKNELFFKTPFDIAGSIGLIPNYKDLKKLNDRYWFGDSSKKSKNKSYVPFEEQDVFEPPLFEPPLAE